MDIKGKIPDEDLIKVYGDEILNTVYRTNCKNDQLKNIFTTLVWIFAITQVAQLLLLLTGLILLL